ncbi:MAG: glycosyltransferase, partial [Exiguobacterium sp.]
AQAANYVLTSDEAMIPEYRVLCGHDRIMAMPFGVNPLIHNPIGATRSRKKGVLFAGSWMAKYPERVKDTEMLFDGVMQSSHELDIVDRNYHLDLPAYQFPERYQSRVAPAIPYDALQQVSKCYDWVLNLNSIKYSKTMCARRVYESQALGNLILSNYSIAVNNEFPNIFTVHDAQEATAIVERTSQEEIERLRAEGLRAVMTEHTVFERMDQILAFIGRVPETRKHRLLIVVAQDGEVIRDVINRQSLTPDEIVSADALTEQTYDQADLVAWMDGQESYGEYYLEDLVNGFKYSDASIVRKGSQHPYHLHEMNGSRNGAIIWRSDIGYDAFQADELNGKTLLLDQFEWNEQTVVPTDHTPQLSVVVPIYNNGKHLTYKCFASLTRMDRFMESEILLVDDGSTDIAARQAVERLARRYGNVRTYFFETGGSGSASRPRNKGVEMARADYVTFLDPDNEVLSDRYAFL